ncbi:E3 ubiquitin/ISG15 ligase TRIM25-like [Hoplias malabaricus]|uniref:E3 ubiquitin/ISG15 ligase TRIM25-like n=1 Tax=Hoplias malabaricus TaxID=27720 RepID=UPI0034628165
MAEASISIDQDHFNCSICLQLMKEPVTTPCGHTFCMICINGFWDKENVFNCPQCRENFRPRPMLRRNNILAEVIKNLQESTLQPSPLPTCLELCSSEDQDVECDSCVGKKKKAVKSCLTCLASFCDVHLKPHNESEIFKKHKLVSAFRNLQEKICPQHDKLLEVFCRTDKKVICSLCLLDKHKGHNTVSVQEEWMEKKKQCENLQMKYQDRVERREKALQLLNELMETFRHCAQTAVEDNEKAFKELIRSIEKTRSDATELVRTHEKSEMERGEELGKKLEKEIGELKKKKADLEQLSHTRDYVSLVQTSQALCADLENNDPLKIAFNPHPAFENFKTSVLQLKIQLENVCTQEWMKMSKDLNDLINSAPQPETREEFLKYARELTLDPNTVNYYLQLSECKTKVNNDGGHHSYTDHPQRFTSWQQVLCYQNVSLRSYWEVEVGGDNGVSIAVTSKGIKRKGSQMESRFGHNIESCRLVCYPMKYSFWHNDKQIDIPGTPYKRIGVYLDEKAGTLFFYGVSNRMNLIHKTTAKFTPPLYPGFGVGTGSHANICLYAASGATSEPLKKKGMK